ncbi:MAG TPA: hypothetical protein PLD47_01130 [Aggregatilineales bacterium]|nr:hypothetical protein [Anaerolineales bacterium]HRE46301.1 hypothetical protein [Aggregatilineales bacterium]
MRKGIVLLIVTMLTTLTAYPARAQDDRERRPRLPAPLCALAGGRLICYDAQTAQPTPLSDPDLRVLDFDLAPDGLWAVYRTEDGQVWIGSLQDARRAQLDADALPPAALAPTDRTLVWSPDGITISYIVAGGVRVAFPGADGAPIYTDFTDRLYTNLTIAPNGGRLAVQDVNDTWTVFTVTKTNGSPQSVTRTAVVDRPAEAAWLDDNSLILAPAMGGLLRLNVINTISEGETRLMVAWEKPDGHFTKLTHTLDGTIRAFYHELNEGQGTPIAILGSGEVSAVGGTEIDARAEWIAEGTHLVYITSGTPIFIEPATASEDYAPIQRVTRLAWGAPPMNIAGTLAMDGDLFFLARAENGVRQVFQLPGSGVQPIQQMTTLPENVAAFGVSADRRSVVVAMGQRLILLPLHRVNEAPTPTPAGFRETPIPDDVPGIAGSRLLATLDTAAGAFPTWRSDGGEIAYVQGNALYTVSLPLIAGVLPTPRLVYAAPSDSYLTRPAYSPDRRTLIVEQVPIGGGSLSLWVSIPLTSWGAPVEAAAAAWGLNALFYGAREGAGWALLASDGRERAVLALSAAPILDVRPLPGGLPGIGGGAAVYLENIGWAYGSTVIRARGTVGEAAAAAFQGVPVVMPNAILSPTGRFAAGVGLANDGKMNKLIVVDVQNGRRLMIRDAADVSDPIWIR